MALCRHRNEEIVRQHKLKAVFPIALIATMLAMMGCASAATPIPPTSTPAPVSTNTPVPTETPVPTRRPPFTCPTPATGDGPPFTSLPAIEEGPALAQALARLPASYRDQGLWFADYSGAIDLAGAPDPSSLDEFLALSEAAGQKYLAATRDLIFPSSMLQRAKQYAREWNEAFGFDWFAASLMVSTGFPSSDPFGATYLELKSGTADIRQHLLDLGYQECAAAVGVYYAIRHDREQGLSDPVARMASSTMNRVALGDSWMVSAPDTDKAVSFLEVAAGGATLRDDPAISSLALALGDPLSAAFLTREMALEPEGHIEPVPAVRQPKPKDWGSLHQWEAIGIGYGIYREPTLVGLLPFLPRSNRR